MSGMSKGGNRHKGYIDMRYQVPHDSWWGTHTGWGAHIQGGLARQLASFGGARWALGPGPGTGPAPPWPPQSWPAAWPGHPVCGLPTMYGFPTMYYGVPGT